MKESNFAKTHLPIWQEKNGKDSHLFRNNTGAWKDKFNRWTFYGIGLLRRKNKKSPYRPVGGGDYLGWTSKTICEIIHGKKRWLEPCVGDCSLCLYNKQIAIFTSIEYKTKGVVETTDQKAWKKLVLDSGGIAEVIRE